MRIETSSRWIAPASTITLLVLIVTAWYVAADAFHVAGYILPRPSQVIAQFSHNSGELASATRTTVEEVVLAFAASTVAGVACGWLTAKHTAFRRSIYPLLVASQTVPLLAAAPIIGVWFGYGLLPKIIIATLVAFFPIVLGAAVGIRSVSADQHRLGRAMGLSSLAFFLKVELPASLPSIFGGLKIASALSVVGAVVAEFLGSNSGLGNIVLTASGDVDTPSLFAALILMVALGLALFAAVAALERWVVPWADER